MKLSFTKMQGCANDYIYLDCRTSGVPEKIVPLAQKLSARHFSVGADGIICICAPRTPGADGTMRIFNADGSEAQMCGNGIRCVAEWLHVHDPACAEKSVLKIDTQSGLKTLTRMGEELWQVEMGVYSAMAADLPAVNMGEGPLVRCPLEVDGKPWNVTCISVGNPHCVTLVDDVDSLKLEAIGPAFECHPNFPERINRVRRSGGRHPPENAGVGARQRRNMGLRHRHLCHRGGAGGAGPLPRGRRCPCSAAGR